MATMTDVVRKITIQSTQTGANETAAALDKMALAQGNVAITAERSSKSMLSMESSLHKLKLSLDEEYRSEEKLAQIEKTLHAARLQGAVSIEEQNRLLGLAKLKYTEAGEAAKVMGERMETAKELAKGLLTGIGVGVVFTGLAELPAKIMETVHEAAGLTHVAETIGITTKSLQELQFTGAQFHVSTESMDTALEKFAKNLGIAATGSGELAKILGINHVKITGDVTKDFLAYATLIQHATDTEQRNMLVTAAFGKGAAEFGLMFEHGGAGLKAYADEAEKMGAVLNDKALKSAADLDAEFVKMQSQLDVTFKDFAISVAPALVGSLKLISDAVKDVNIVLDNSKPVEDRVLIRPLQNNLVDAENKIATLKAQIAAGQNAGYRQNSYPKQLEDEYANASRLQEQIDQLSGKKPPAGPNFGDHAIASDETGAGWHTLSPKAPDAAAAAAAKKLQSVTDALNLQLKTLTETDRQKQIDTELSKAGVEASTKQGKAIEALTGKLYDEKKALADANQAANFLAQSTETAFEGIITGSSSVQDALAGIVKALAQAVIQAELLGSGPLAGILGTSPTTSGGAGGILGSLFSALIPHANGGVYNSPSLSAYSNQVVTKPTLFAFANGGVMGEAGPEAIMPLRRGPDGKLGVSAANSNAAAPSIVYAPVYNFQSASIEELARIKAQAAADRESFAVRVQKAMGDKRTR
jgi:hypothetical protein